jgi:hypothetical protein
MYVHKQYFLCPFSTYDTVVGTQVAKYRLKTNCTTVRPFYESLNKVEDDATLIIAGHGVEGAEEISNGMKDASRLSYTAAGLAQLISKVWQLPTTHRKIRLLGCECADFAKKVAVALPTYDNVAVGGYIDEMNWDGYNAKTGRGSGILQIPPEKEGGTITLLSKEQMISGGMQRVKWYNNKGAEISKPDLQKTFLLQD